MQTKESTIVESLNYWNEPLAVADTNQKLDCLGNILD